MVILRKRVSLVEDDLHRGRMRLEQHVGHEQEQVQEPAAEQVALQQGHNAD